MLLFVSVADYKQLRMTLPYIHMYKWFLVFLSLLHLEIAYKAHVLAIYGRVGPLGLYTLGEFAASVKQKLQAIYPYKSPLQLLLAGRSRCLELNCCS